MKSHVMIEKSLKKYRIVVDPNYIDNIDDDYLVAWRVRHDPELKCSRRPKFVRR